MKKNYIFSICFFTFTIIVGVMIIYKIRTPALNNMDIRGFKNKHSRESDYINKINFKYHEAGLEIQYYTKNLSKTEANIILEDTQKFISNQKFIDYFAGKYRKKYKNITRHLSNDYAPPATIIIYDVDNMIAIYKFSANAPYVNWSAMN